MPWAGYQSRRKGGTTMHCSKQRKKTSNQIARCKLKKPRHRKSIFLSACWVVTARPPVTSQCTQRHSSMLQHPVLFRCRICGNVFPPAQPADGSLQHDQHPTGCPSPVAELDEKYEKEDFPCYSCGKCKPYVTFSPTQHRKGPYGRCAHCISAGVRSRFELAVNSPTWISKYDLLGEALVDAVAEYDLLRVRSLLKRGADPNYNRQNHVYDRVTMSNLPTWLPDRRPAPELDTDINLQPTTPLKTLVFWLSSASYGGVVFEAKIWHQMAQALLRAGADPEPAGRFVRATFSRRGDPGRFGTNDLEFEQVCCLIEDALDS